MENIQLSALTPRAQEILSNFGNEWVVKGTVYHPDEHFFQEKKPQMYITPVVKHSGRNPKENLGDNYKPPSKINGLGSRWIDADGDPDFKVEKLS